MRTSGFECMVETEEGETDLHDHEGNAVRVRPAGALESHSKMDVGHVWLPDSHIGSSPEVGLLQDQRLVANMQAAEVHSGWLVHRLSVIFMLFEPVSWGIPCRWWTLMYDVRIFAYIRCK